MLKLYIDYNMYILSIFFPLIFYSLSPLTCQSNQNYCMLLFILNFVVNINIICINLCIYIYHRKNVINIKL